MGVKGVTTVNVNLNSMLKKAMHLPRTKSGYALYSHVKTFKDDGTTGDIIESGALADADYVRLKDTTYNSPKNIRRLFITGSRVYIQYYTSYFKDGKQDQGTWEERALKDDEGKNLFDIAKEIVDYTENINAYIASLNVDPNAKLPKNYSFKSANTNNLFKALSNGWVTSNIEEIYFDWTALMPEEVFTRITNMFSSPYDVIKTFSTNQQTTFSELDKLKQLILEFNAKNIKDISSRYPRLRKVAMIQKLDEIMQSPMMDKAGIKPDLTFSESTKTWMDLNLDLIKSYGGYIYYANFGGKFDEYKTAESQYLFDSTLKVWFETHIDKLKKLRRKELFKDEETSENTDDSLNIEIGEIENRLIELEKSINNTQSFNQLLKLSVIGYKPSELKQIFSMFTKENRNKYASIIGIKF